MARAIRRVLDDVPLDPSTIGCITLTATGSPVYDRMLSLAVNQALGDRLAAQIPVTTWESSVGHALAATGTLALVHAEITLRDRTVYPTFNVEQVDSECRLNYIVEEPVPLRSPVVLTLLVGFGGQNGAALLVDPSVALDWKSA